MVGGLFLSVVFACAAFPLMAQQTLVDMVAVRHANVQIAQTVASALKPSEQTRATLLARRAVLEQVFRDTPAAARSYALDAKTRNALLKADPTYAPLVEQDVPLTSELVITVQDNLKAHTSQNRVQPAHLHEWLRHLLRKGARERKGDGAPSGHADREKRRAELL